MDFISCKICTIPYDEEEHKPRNPLCGHELCSSCIKALIRDGIFECPKCREKNKANVSEDFQINFGLITVIRAFKNQNIAHPKEPQSSISGPSNNDLCKIHTKSIEHRCTKCQRWLCVECLEDHTALTGCSTISSSNAVRNLKDKHTKNTEMLLSKYEDETNNLLSKIKEHTDQKEELLKRIEKHEEEIKKIRSIMDQGDNKKEKVVKSRDLLSTSTTPYAVMDRIEVLDQMKLSLQNWSIKNLGTDTQFEFLKALKEDKNVYGEMVFDGRKIYSKLSQHKEGIYLHTFWDQTIENGSMFIPLTKLQKLIPSCPSLIFFEFSLGGSAIGTVIVELDKNLPNLRENMVNIVTGMKGNSLRGIQLDQHNSLLQTPRSRSYLYVNDLKQFNNLPVKPDSNAKSNAKRGDFVGQYNAGYLQYLCFTVTTCNFFSSKVLGSIVAGMEIIQKCHDNPSPGIMITDCGLVLEKNYIESVF